jgi:hypothetical protein
MGGSTARGGSGGSGGSSACPDNDGDGVTTCAGDCDDNDPNNFPGNAEQCGDNKDNNCDNVADNNCGGIGTYVSNLFGKASNPGTQPAPVDTIAHGMMNAQTISMARGGGPITVFVGEGHYSEKVTLQQGISIQGGYQCDTTTCTWQRNPTTYDSAILDTDAEGVLATDAITRITLLDGLRIMGQDGAATGQGRAAVTLRGGTPTISNNRIFAPSVSGGGYPGGRSHGILIQGVPNSPQGALITNNEINYAPSGGVSFGKTPSGSTTGITIEPGNAGSPSAEIRSNIIRGGQAETARGISIWGTTDALLIEGNDIGAGSASNTAFAVEGGGRGTVNANTINTGLAVGDCGTTTNWCGGIKSESSNLKLTNNVVLGLDALWSVGVYLGEIEVAAGAVTLNSNTIDGAGRAASNAGSKSSAVLLYIGLCCGTNGTVGSIRNNILGGGTAESRFGIYEDPNLSMGARTMHPVALENNLFFVNTSGPGTGTLYRFVDNQSAVTLLTTIASVNNLASLFAGIAGKVGANIEGDPLLDATYHLGTGSPAINKATATEAPPLDIDGESRPKGGTGDIGADEAQ